MGEALFHTISIDERCRYSVPKMYWKSVIFSPGSFLKLINGAKMALKLVIAFPYMATYGGLNPLLSIVYEALAL